MTDRKGPTRVLVGVTTTELIIWMLAGDMSVVEIFRQIGTAKSTWAH